MQLNDSCCSSSSVASVVSSLARYPALLLMVKGRSRSLLCTEASDVARQDIVMPYCTYCTALTECQALLLLLYMHKRYLLTALHSSVAAPIAILFTQCQACDMKLGTASSTAAGDAKSVPVNGLLRRFGGQWQPSACSVIRCWPSV